MIKLLNWTKLSVKTSKWFKLKISSCITDIIECTNEDNPCHANASCIDIPGAYECMCFQGFSGNGTYCDGMDLLACWLNKIMSPSNLKF